MKRFKSMKLCAIVGALLTFVMVFSLAACGKKDDEGGSNGLTLNSYSQTIDEGSTTTLLVTSSTTDAVVWTSSDESKVTVAGSGTGNRAGTVQAVAIGTATVTATAGDKFATCQITVVEKEKITVTQNGTAVTSLTLSGENATAQLAASSSREHDIEWSVDKDLIVSVSDNGLVTALAASGTAEITAKCAQHSDVFATVTVVVGSGEDAAYDLIQGDENNSFGNPVNSNDKPGVWMYWNQYGNVKSATYDDGTVNLVTSGVEEGALWYNVQVFYTAAASDKDTAGNALKAGTHYEVTFDITTSMAGGITVNGYPLQLKEGVNHCTAYYDHAATAFAMQLGIEGVGCTITNATISLSNIKWTVSQKVNLAAPSFSISSNVITITDTNPAGSVGSYTLNLYNESGSAIGGVVVTNGATVNTSRIRPNGTYTGKLVANAANAHYIASPEATSANATVVVDNEDVIYNMAGSSSGGALAETGVWTYWTESWVSFNGVVTNDVAKVTFSNNTGNWYDTQMFYKTPGKNVGDTYTVKLHVDNAPKAGRISVNDVVYTLAAGENTLTIKVTETSGVSIQIIFGVNGENQKQDIGAATDLQIYVELA